MQQLKKDPVKGLLSYYRTAAVWGALLLGAVLLQYLPLFGGKVWILPLVPPLAGHRRGRVVGLFVGIAAGFLHDWTAAGGFGVAGVLLGAIGYLCGV